MSLDPPLDDSLRVAVGAQPHREVEPALVHLGQLIAVDEERAGADRFECGGGALRPILLDDGVLAGVGVHVAEDEGGGGLGRRQVGDRLHDHLGRVRARARARVRVRVRVRARC